MLLAPTGKRGNQRVASAYNGKIVNGYYCLINPTPYHVNCHNLPPPDSPTQLTAHNLDYNSPTHLIAATMPALINAKHEIFAQHLARGQFQREALVTAGYADNASNASTLAKRPEIAARVQELQMAIASRVKVTADRVLTELARIGFSNVTDAIEIKRGKVKIRDTESLPEDVKAAIAEIRAGREGTVVKFHDKTAALEKLGKHLGLFKENVDLNVNISLADLVNGSYQLERDGKLLEAAGAIPELEGPVDAPRQDQDAPQLDPLSDTAQQADEPLEPNP